MSVRLVILARKTHFCETHISALGFKTKQDKTELDLNIEPTRGRRENPRDTPVTGKIQI